jgi:hypothetical protein
LIKEKITFYELENVLIEFNEVIMQTVNEKESAGETELHTVLEIYARLSVIVRQLEELKCILSQIGIKI